ncbi:MAG: DUF5979 domain-containing protein [Actinomycetota bacterium]|nr:DUF5979 domain-containing protein [Actinomycetota bacterium]
MVRGDGSGSSRRLAASVALLLGAALAGAPAADAAPPTASLALAKNTFQSGTSTPLTGPVTPGGTYDYQLSAACSGLTQGCVGATTIDPLPTDVQFEGADPSPLYTVAYNAATRTVSITYTDVLPAPPNPAGARGIPAGSTRVATLHVRLAPATTSPDGSTITNTARASADNADPVQDSANITVSVPRQVRALASKTLSPASLVARSGARTTATLTVRNASSSSAGVTALTVGDTSADTWDDFNLTSVGPLEQLPAGADQVSVQYCTAPAPCTAAQFVGGPYVAGPNLALPAGVDPATVTGIRFAFRNSAGTVLPASTTAGRVPIELTLRDTVRSTGAALDPTSPLNQRNCASPVAVDRVDGEVAGADACVPFTVQPGTARVEVAKQFFPDAAGTYVANGYAVSGQESGVTALSRATNASAFPVTNLTITEPSATAPTDFADVAVTTIRLVFPSGATAAAGTVTCGDGSTVPITASTTVTLPAGCPAASPPTRITVTYTGLVPAGAQAQLGVHGTLDPAVAGNTTLTDCTDASIQTAGQGAATATGCAPLPVENPRVTVSGVKSSSSPATGGALVPGYPVTFTLQAANSGNLPESEFTITDPDPGAPGANPFDVVQLTSATLTTAPSALAGSFTIEVFDPAAATWVAYAAGDGALLARSTGIRARLVNGLVPPTSTVTLRFTTAVRATAPIGATFVNCQRTVVSVPAVGAGSSGSACAPRLTVALPRAAGQVGKAISPGSVPAPIAGVNSTAQVQLRAQNTGNVPLNRIVVTDPDPAQDAPDTFFDAVAVTSLDAVNFPPGANRVQVDACLSRADCRAGTYTSGAPSSALTLPPGVSLADVAGLRFTFTDASGNYLLTPGSNFPRTGACRSATVCFSVTPRATSRSSGTAIAYPAQLSDIATAGGQSPISGGQLVSFGSAPAPLNVTAGSIQLNADKTASPAVVPPGQAAVYQLATTNTGTGAVPSLVLTEPLAPPLVFDPAFNNGAGYQLAATVPTGTPQPPLPTFTRTADPATGGLTLTWTFPAEYAFLPTSVITITFQANLQPGTTAGAPALNTYGATTADTNARPRLSCARGAADPTLGCTASARVTAGAGNGVDAQKWVHGDDRRGSYNTVTKTFVSIGDPGCPLLTVGNANYTRFPCIALVLAGQNFDFLLNLTNVGTTPITQTRLVDYLPKVGDRGVVLSAGRDTEWNPRPRLSAAPSLVPGRPGTLALGYSTTSPTCTTDIARPPSNCPADAWTPVFSPDAEAFRGFLDFVAPLPPAGSTQIVVPMSAPANLDTTTNQLPIAWNSFAHTDFFREANGSITQLRAVEPEKVGVALPFGTLQIDKTVTGDLPPGSLIGPFRGTYTCVVTTAGGEPVTVARGEAEFNAGTPFTVNHVPAGAVCTVVETDTGGGNVTQPDPVTIQPDIDTTLPRPTSAVIVNDFPAPRLIVTKRTAGGAARYATGPFTLRVLCRLGGATIQGYPHDLTFIANQTQSVRDDPNGVRLPIGAECTVSEPDTRGASATSTAYSDGDHATISAVVDGVATVTNTYDPAQLAISKTVVGPGGAGPYTFGAACTLTSNTGTEIPVPLAPADATFRLANRQNHVITVPKGASCLIEERRPPPGDTPSYNGSRTATPITVGGSATVSVVNTFARTPTPSGSQTRPSLPSSSSSSSSRPNPPNPPNQPPPPDTSGLAFTGAGIGLPLVAGLSFIGGGVLLCMGATRRRRAH